MAQSVMSWNECHITTTASFAEELSNELSELGAVAITFKDAGDQPIFEPTPETTILWKDTVVVGLFEGDQSLEPIIQTLENLTALGKLKNFHIQSLADENWERKCLEGFEPICCGNRLWICPSWHNPPDPNAVNVILDPGLAFGTGTHPTTRLCLEWLDQVVTPGDTVIDYGCGSGILAIAALKLGAKQAIAIDNDPQALEATLANSQRNHIPTDTLLTQYPGETISEKATLLIANILAGPLVELAPTLANLIKPEGKIALSGILKEQSDKIFSAYEPYFLMENPVFLEEWLLIQGVRRKLPD